MAGTGRQRKNLLLDADAIARGERYSRRHATNLSRLVGDFLRSLPLGETSRPRSPIVKRLRGVAAGGKAERAAYRAHLHRKYGGR